MTPKTVIFVQGMKSSEKDFPWMFHHFHPASDIKMPPIRLAFFDYISGELKIWNRIVLKRGRSEPRAKPDKITKLSPITHIRKHDGSVATSEPKRASVIALYDWVKTQPSGSVLSLQVFSHGTPGGPLLWNSWEFDARGDPMDPSSTHDRDAHDVDFRIRDFKGKNPLAGSKGRSFAKAFAANAFIKVWGCNFSPHDRAIAQKFKKVRDPRRMSAAQVEALQIYLDAIEDTYPMALAKLVGKHVWASPVGWGSTPWSTVRAARGRTFTTKYRGNFPPNLNHDQWWRMSWYFRNQDGGANLYSRLLGAPIDATDFVGYHAGWLASARKIAPPAAPVP